MSGGYRPDSESSEFPRIDQPGSVPSPAQAQPRTSVTGVLGGRCRDVAVTDCVCIGVYVGLWCVYVYVLALHAM